MIKQPIECHCATLHGPLDAVPAPAPPPAFPGHSARVAPGGPTLRRLSSPRVAVLGRPSPWPCALRRGRCAALGTREEPWGGAVGGACSPAGGAGGVLPGGGRKNTVCFSYSLLGAAGG